MRAAERPASRLPTTRIGAATRGHSTARRPPLRSAPSAWGATVPHPTTVASAAPFSPAGRRQLTSVDGQPTTDPPPEVMTVVVEPSYFQTVVRGLILGEPFSELHGTPGHEAAIVNQRFAEVYLGAGSPIGRHVELRLPTAQRTYLRESDAPVPPVAVELIGVAPAIRQVRDAVPMVYLPFRADAPAAVALIVRGS